MTEMRITSRRNPLLQQARKLLSSRRERERTGLFAAEGTKLLEEAVRWYPGLDTVILADGVEQPLPEGVRVVRVSREIMASLSEMDAPQGALFLCRYPKEADFVPQKGMLLLDGIQDPGNLGTILRTADALEIPVALLDGCADLYSPKTVRASMGAVFRTQFVQTTWERAGSLFAQAGIPVAVTEMSTQAEDLRSARPEELAVVIGSEGQGVRPEIRRSASRRLVIPMNPRCESLNAAIAAALVMWQMKR